MIATKQYYAKELLEAAKPYLLFEAFAGKWERRKLPWVFRQWPLRVFIRQWKLVSPKLVGSPARTIKFRRYHEPRRN